MKRQRIHIDYIFIEVRTQFIETFFAVLGTSEGSLEYDWTNREAN